MTGAEILTNRGRWGSADERGTLNFITPEASARGAAEVRTGLSVSLAYPVTPVPLAAPVPFGANPMPAGVMQVMTYTGSPSKAMVDLLVINTHHASVTHIDALAHVPIDGQVYPGVDLDAAVVRGTVAHGSTTAFAAGLTTRGVFLDLASSGRVEAGREITSADLDAAEERSGLHVESGDALALRAGWDVGASIGQTVPVLTLDAVGWLARREISLYLGDVGDPPPIRPGIVMALHGVALPQLGLPLIDNPDLSGLAEMCARTGRNAFLLALAPLRIHGLTGVPVNPLAIF
ncbi:cyclase family protein [Salinibacterium sp.]|uniref:cyclase family protein n=1 Tax=Salinibacterium sp. TaxID=1915057 RepID=UPI00286A2C11|nr:cyclase family protein [Salinibacterium sp.]